jgi:hypothetical protein
LRTALLQTLAIASPFYSTPNLRVNSKKELPPTFKEARHICKAQLVVTTYRALGKVRDQCKRQDKLGTDYCCGLHYDRDKAFNEKSETAIENSYISRENYKTYYISVPPQRPARNLKLRRYNSRTIGEIRADRTICVYHLRHTSITLCHDCAKQSSSRAIPLHYGHDTVRWSLSSSPSPTSQYLYGI